MAKRQSKLPLAAMEKIFKKAGAERVSDKAKSALGAVLEEAGEVLAKNAVSLAGHAGRKTVKANDVRLASRQL